MAATSQPKRRSAVVCTTSLALALALALGAGCAHAPAPSSSSSEKPPITIAVISFGGSNETPSEAEDGCVMALLEAGYRVVDRPRIIATVPNENDVDYTSAGRLLGADLIIEGGWTRNSGEPPRRLESRLISTHSANVLGTTEDKAHARPGRALGRKICSELLAQLP